MLRCGAVPALASAQEIYFEPAEAFTILGSGGELRAPGEPTITCTKTESSGKADTGSTTTGTLTLYITGSHMAIFGITASCKSDGTATASTVHISGTWHSIIMSGIPATLWTLSSVRLVRGILVLSRSQGT